MDDNTPPRGLTLRFRLLALMLPLAVLLTPAVAYFAYRAAATPLLAQADGTLHSAARMLSRTIERTVGAWHDSVASLADSRQTRDAVASLRVGYRELIAEMGPALNDAAWARIGAELRTRYDHLLVQPLKTVRGAAPETEGWLPGREGMLLQGVYAGAGGGQREALVAAGSDPLRLQFAKTKYQAAVEQNEGIWESYADRNGLADLVLADTDGMILYTLRRTPLLGQSLSSAMHRGSAPAETFRAAMVLGTESGFGAVSSDASPSEWDGDDPSLWIGSAVTDDAGRRIGVILARVSLVRQLDPLVAFFGSEENAGLGQTGAAIVVGGDGKARSNYRFVGRLAAGSKRALIGGGETTALRLDLSDNAAVQRLTRQAQGPRTGRIDAKGDSGQLVRAAYSPLRLPDLSWGVVVMQDYKEGLRAAEILRNVLGIGAAVLTLSLCVFVFVAARRLSLPLAELASAAQRITQGADRTRVKVRRMDEVGVAATSVNTMLDQLDQQRSEREREIRELRHGVGAIQRVVSALGANDLRERTRLDGQGPLGELGMQMDSALDSLSRTIAGSVALVALVQRATVTASGLQQQLGADVEQSALASMQSHGFAAEGQSAMQNVVVVTSSVSAAMQGEVTSAMTETLTSSQMVESGLRKISDEWRSVARKLKAISERAMGHHIFVTDLGTLAKRMNSAKLNLDMARQTGDDAGLRDAVREIEDLNTTARDFSARFANEYQPFLRDIASAAVATEEQAEYLLNHASTVEATEQLLLGMQQQVEAAVQSMVQLDRLAQSTEAKLEAAATQSHKAAQLSEASIARAKETQTAVSSLEARANGLAADAQRFALPGTDMHVALSTTAC